MSQRLPSLPNLDHLKKQAKDVLRVSRHWKPRWRLADAQHALARGYGFSSWPHLKAHVESVRRQSAAPPSGIREPEDGTADAAPSRSDRSSHPIVGTWTARPNMDNDESQPHSESVVVEFDLADGALILTQIAADAAGRNMAMKMAIKADGLDHPIQFGDELTLQATWSGARTLETVVKRRDQIVATGTYEVAADGQSLVVSTSERRIVFERV